MEQSRKKFLKNFFIGATSVPLILEACKKESTSGSGSGSSTCPVAPTETEGPYPTHSPSSYVRSDIRDGRTGVNMTMNITIKNTNNNCAALSGVIVDVWHCDKDGNYSNGLVSFTTIFPGWYNGRSTHIHVHIYNAAGTSLKITQISFPEGSGSAVQTVNSTEGQAYGYTKGMSGYTYATSDGIFSDDTALVEQASVAGSLAAGYVLTHAINVAG
jgi:protocatechuate 3,4-dioxygenase beta subunit